MLDKSLPYVDIFMRRPAGAKLPKATLPEGYGYKLFMPGDETAWARIEASVGEFGDETSALEYFRREFMPCVREMCRRCMFIVAPNGEKVATATAFWDYIGVVRAPWLHWVAVKPEYQNCGLGKAVVALTLQLMFDIEGDRDMYLHTQTWSHKAIGIYQKAGFDMIPDSGLGCREYANFDKAMRVMDGIK